MNWRVVYNKSVIKSSLTSLIDPKIDLLFISERSEISESHSFQLFLHSAFCLPQLYWLNSRNPDYFCKIHFTLHPDTLPWSKFGCFHLLCKLECSWKFNSSAHKLHNIWEPWVSISLNRTGADLPSVTCRVNGLSVSSNEKAGWKASNLSEAWKVIITVTGPSLTEQ